MKKLLEWLGGFFLLGIIVLLAGNVFLKFYFNRFLYVTPDLRGKTYQEAKMALEDAGFSIGEGGRNISNLPKGQLFKQIPEAGQEIKKGRKINVWISEGVEGYEVPDLLGYDLSEAREVALKDGFSIKDVLYVYKEGAQLGRVFATSPAPGTPSESKEISLIIASKEVKDQVKVPDIIGLTLEGASANLKEADLTLGSVSYTENLDIDNGTIVDMELDPGTLVDKGTEINITVNRGESN